jgi:hypothetical protein
MHYPKGQSMVTMRLGRWTLQIVFGHDGARPRSITTS